MTEAAFNAAADAFFPALPDFEDAMIALGAAADADRVAAQQAVTDAAGQVTLASNQVTLANAARTAAELARDISVGAADYRGDWNAGTAYLTGQSVTNGGKRFVAKRNNTGVTPVEGLDWYEIITGSPWVQIGPDVATTSGTQVTFANIPQTYNDLFFQFIQVSCSSSNVGLNVAVSDNGTDYTTGQQVGFFPSDASVGLSGQFPVPGYKTGIVPIWGALANLPTARTSASLNVTVTVPSIHRLNAPVTHVRFSPASGSFDAGLIRLFGR